MDVHLSVALRVLQQIEKEDDRLLRPPGLSISAVLIFRLRHPKEEDWTINTSRI